jgi:glutamyl-tRNA reductase
VNKHKACATVNSSAHCGLWPTVQTPSATLQKMASTLTNKLIHPTTAAIRDASAEGRTDRLDFIQTTHDLAPQTLP